MIITSRSRIRWLHNYIRKHKNSGDETQVSEIDHKMKNWTLDDQQNHTIFRSAKLMKVQDEIMTQYLF